MPKAYTVPEGWKMPAADLDIIRKLLENTVVEQGVDFTASLNFKKNDYKIVSHYYGPDMTLLENLCNFDEQHYLIARKLLAEVDRLRAVIDKAQYQLDTDCSGQHDDCNMPIVVIRDYLIEALDCPATEPEGQANV